MGSNTAVHLSMRHLIPTELVCAAEVFLSAPKIHNVITSQGMNKAAQGPSWTKVCVIALLRYISLTASRASVCACVCLLVAMICSQVKGKWMHILMPSARVSRMSNTQLIFAHH